MFKLFSDMYFVVYKLYYIDQNDDLDIRVSLKNWDGGSTVLLQPISKSLLHSWRI
jgi:hypothetical protein